MKIFFRHDQKWMWPIWFGTLILTVSQEWTDGNNWFFAGWYKLTQIKKWLNVLGGHGQNGCGQSSYGTLTFTVFEEWTDGINWSSVCWYRFTKFNSLSKFFWVGMFKNWRGQSGHKALKLTISQKRCNKLIFLHDFFAGKQKVDSIIFWWAWSKMAVAF